MRHLVAILVWVAFWAVGWWMGRATARRALSASEVHLIRRTCQITWMMIGLFVIAPFELPRPWHLLVPGILLFVLPALLYRWSLQRQLLRERSTRASPSRR